MSGGVKNQMLVFCVFCFTITPVFFLVNSIETALDQLLGSDLVSCQDSTFQVTILNSMDYDLWVSDLLLLHCLTLALWHHSAAWTPLIWEVCIGQ